MDTPVDLLHLALAVEGVEFAVLVYVFEKWEGALQEGLSYRRCTHAGFGVVEFGQHLYTVETLFLGKTTCPPIYCR